MIWGVIGMFIATPITAVIKIILDHGEYYRSLAYLGLGRIYAFQERKDQAVYNLNKSLSFAETKDVTDEAEALLGKVQ